MLSGSLLRKLSRRRKHRPRVWRPPSLTVGKILAWADEHHHRTGRWPNVQSGVIPGTDGDTWKKIDSSLRMACRGITNRTSLYRLLFDHRGVGRLRDHSFLTVEQVLAWADAHYRRHGAWPTAESDVVKDSPGNTWCGVNASLIGGYRGLPSGRSLAQLLSDERGFRNIMRLPRLGVRQILKWVDAYHAEHDRWPDAMSGPIPDSRGETWRAVSDALMTGRRGLKKTTLQGLLAKHRGYRNHMALPRYDIETILKWADAYHAENGRWPTVKSGEIPGAPGEAWLKVSTALTVGLRGLPGGGSLVKLLMERRGALSRERPASLKAGNSIRRPLSKSRV